MADITMCKGEGCEVKATCHRFTAEPNEHRQSYFMESPIVNEGCEYYINHNNYLKKNYKHNTSTQG